MHNAEEAVRRFLDGEHDAFTWLVCQWQGRIFNLALRFLGNREDAQDLVQDTFLSAFRSLKNLRDPKSFSTWLYRIALNHCRARWRNKSNDVSLDEPVMEDDGSGSIPSHLDRAPANSGDTVETVDLIKRALIGISEDHRSAIILKEYLGLSLEEIAAVMDCPLSTAKSRLYHGLRGVQRNLQRLGVKLQER